MCIWIIEEPQIIFQKEKINLSHLVPLRFDVNNKKAFCISKKYLGHRYHFCLHFFEYLREKIRSFHLLLIDYHL